MTPFQLPTALAVMRESNDSTVDLDKVLTLVWISYSSWSGGSIVEKFQGRDNSLMKTANDREDKIILYLNKLQTNKQINKNQGRGWGVAGGLVEGQWIVDLNA